MSAPETRIDNRPTTSPSPPYDYDVFISYRRVDGTLFARWIRSKLQSYKMPKRLRATSAPLRVYIDTTYERASEDFWERNLKPALERSRYLLLVASHSARPGRGTSPPTWVEREVKVFTSLPQGRNILVTVLDGDPGGPLPGGLKEAFPNLEIVDFTAFKPGPLATLRRRKLRDNLLTLLATLHGVSDRDMPLLRQEDRRRTVRKAVGLIAVAAALTLTFSAVWVRSVYRESRMQYASWEREEIERRYSYCQLLLVQLNSAVAELDRYAMERYRPKQLANPFDMLSHARERVRELNEQLKSINPSPGTKWFSLYEAVAKFAATTENLELYNQYGFTQRRDIGLLVEDLREDISTEREAALKRHAID